MYPAQTQQPYYQPYTVQQAYPAHPPPYSQAGPYPGPYPAGQFCPSGSCPQQQQQVIYRQCPQQQGGRSNWANDPNSCWLLSLLTLCCGCFLGEALCDEPCCCCLIPCALPRFR